MEWRLVLWSGVLLLWVGVGYAWSQQERILLRRKSPYNEIQVAQQGHERILRVRQGAQFVEESRCDMRRPAHLLHQYSRLQLVASLYPGELRRALVVGLGGGSLSKALLEVYPELQVDSLELDPEIERVARQFFRFPVGGRSRSLVQDGRAYLEACSESYDLIVLDAFDGLEIPEPLRTRGFYQQVLRHLNPGGVVASNLHRRSQTYDRDRATLAAVFPHQTGLRGTGLVIVLSSDSPLQLHRERWNARWGFQADPLLRLQEATPDFHSDAIPFDDPP